jgi:nicotinamide riboside kinase
MEQGINKRESNLRTIVITGPESTGKTMISAYLADKLNCQWIPEYARDFIGNLTRPYNYDDIVHIAETQVLQKNEKENSGLTLLILDTWLIITKIWFLEVYNSYPEWLDDEILNNKTDLFLVCRPDIPWVPDPLRENGGEKREYLMKRYIEEIKRTGTEYIMIDGIGDSRFEAAVKAVKTKFKLSL